MRRVLAICVALAALGASAQSEDPSGAPPFGLSPGDGRPVADPPAEDAGMPEPPPDVPDAGDAPPEAPDAGTEPPPPPPDAPPPQEPPPEAPPPEDAPPRRAEANGYVMGRFAYTRPKLGGLLPATDVPSTSLLLEVNGQVKYAYWGRSYVYGDVSLIGQAAFGFLELDADGNEVEQAPRDVSAFRPLVSLNELYVYVEPWSWLNLTVGKKRVVWGSGFAFNPTDLLNVRRDPTDPTFQRAGAWMAQLEVPLETLTFTALFSPQVMRAWNGLPYQFVVHPEYDQQDDQAHYLLALRAGALVGDADINLMFFYGNRYNDSFERKFRAGGSFSKVFFQATEVHAELLVQSGSSRLYVNPECVGSVKDAIACGQAEKPFVERSLLQSSMLVPVVLGGIRHTFDDDAILSVEYLYQGDGFTPEQFQDQVSALDLLQQARTFGIPTSRIPGAQEFTGGGAADGVPQRLAFQPTVRHYLFASYQKPRIFDDFTAQAVVIVNLQDLSTIWTPSITWSATEWLNLSAFGFFPVAGPKALSATVASTGEKVSELALAPQNWRFFFEARIFY